MKLHGQKKLMLNRETLKNLGVKTAIRAGAAPTATCTNVPTCC